MLSNSELVAKWMRFFGVEKGAVVTAAQAQEIQAFIWADYQAKQKAKRRLVRLEPKPISAFVNGVVAAINEKRTGSPIEEQMFFALSENSLTFGRVRTQWLVGPYRIDLAFPDVLLAIECDGRAFHSSPAQVEHDMHRTNYLSNLGWKVIRFRGTEIYSDLRGCVDRVAGEYRDLLEKLNAREPWEESTGNVAGA